MEVPDEDERRLIYSQLQALKDIDQRRVSGRDGQLFNSLVDRLVRLGYNAGDFYIPKEEFFVPFQQTRPTVRHGVLHRQLRGLLTYLDLTDNARIVDITLPRIS